MGTRQCGDGNNYCDDGLSKIEESYNFVKFVNFPHHHRTTQNNVTIHIAR